MIPEGHEYGIYFAYRDAAHVSQLLTKYLTRLARLYPASIIKPLTGSESSEDQPISEAKLDATRFTKEAVDSYFFPNHSSCNYANEHGCHDNPAFPYFQLVLVALPQNQPLDLRVRGSDTESYSPAGYVQLATQNMACLECIFPLSLEESTMARSLHDEFLKVLKESA